MYRYIWVSAKMSPRHNCVENGDFTFSISGQYAGARMAAVYHCWTNSIAIGGEVFGDENQDVALVYDQQGDLVALVSREVTVWE